MDILGELPNPVYHVLIGGVIHNYVDGTHVGNSLVDDLLALLLGPQIARAEVALLATLFHFGFRSLGVFLFFCEIANQAVGAFHGIEDGYGTADSAVTSSDDCFFAFELASGPVGLIATVFGGDVFVLGLGAFHVALLARWSLLLDGNLVPYNRVSFPGLGDWERIADGPDLNCEPSLCAPLARFLTVSIAMVMKR